MPINLAEELRTPAMRIELVKLLVRMLLLAIAYYVGRLELHIGGLLDGQNTPEESREVPKDNDCIPLLNDHLNLLHALFCLPSLGIPKS